MKAQATTTNSAMVSAATAPSPTISSASHPAEMLRDRREGIVVGPDWTA